MDRLDILNKELGTNYESLYNVKWVLISEYNKLSENFIREFQNKVNWNMISTFQKLSENFKEEFKYKLND